MSLGGGVNIIPPRQQGVEDEHVSYMNDAARRANERSRHIRVAYQVMGSWRGVRSLSQSTYYGLCVFTNNGIGFGFAVSSLAHSIFHLGIPTILIFPRASSGAEPSRRTSDLGRE